MTGVWRWLSKILSYALAAVLIAYAAVWAARHWDRISAAFSLSPGCLVLLLPTVVVSVLTAGLMTQLMARHLGAPLRFVQWASLAFATMFANYVLPMRAGLAVRAAYYKRQAGLSIARFTSFTAASYLITILVNSLIVLAALLWIGLGRGVTSWPLLWGALVVVVLCGSVLAFSPKPSEERPASGVRGALVRVHTGWEMLRSRPALLWTVGALSFVATLLYTLRLYVAFAAIGYSVDAAGCVLIGALVALSMFISITPAALGIREAAVVFSSLAVGVSPEISLVAATMDRAVTMLVVFVIGPFATVYISRQSAKTGQQ